MSAHTAGAGAFLTFKDEGMSTTPSLTPSGEKNARLCDNAGDHRHPRLFF